MKCRIHHLGRDRGVILLEVVLALILFVGAAVVIGTAMRTSIGALDQTRLQLHALNLATSTMAELQMGSLTMAETQPQPFPAPFEHWTRQILLLPSQAGGQPQTHLQHVEVVIRHDTEKVVHRLSQWMPRPASSGAPPAAPGDLAASSRP